MNEEEFIVFGKPDISDAESNAVSEVLKSGWLSTGSVTHKFEVDFQEFIGGGNAVAVNSCTMGLILALKALEVGPGDEVIVPPLTFCATVNAILAVGANPVFADVDTNGHLDPEEVRTAITHKTKVIMPVHYTGSSCDMDEIRSLGYHNGIAVVEDAAHAFGGRDDDNKRIGSESDFASFSFYATKNITCGEGGMLIVKDPHMAELIRELSMNGINYDAWDRYGTGPVKTYEVAEVGIKGNLSDIQSAIGLTQLKRWPFMRARRGVVWELYEKVFGDRELGHSTHLFTILADDRDYLRKYLYEHGIGTGIHFNPLHLEPAYKFLGHMLGDFPYSELIGAHTVSLPVSSTMDEDDAKRVIQAVADSKVKILEEQRCPKK